MQVQIGAHGGVGWTKGKRKGKRRAELWLGCRAAARTWGAKRWRARGCGGGGGRNDAERVRGVMRLERYKGTGMERYTGIVLAHSIVREDIL